MLSESEYQAWKTRVGVLDAATTVIDEIRRSEPVRRVSGRAGNVTVRYPSRKMGRVIQAESHRVELAAVQWMEYDEDVHEYYDQPNKIELIYLSSASKRVRVLHTPDFFVLRRNRAGWEEWKPEGRLHELAEAMPNRYAIADERERTWQCKPGEAYAKKLGLEYRVRSSSEINWVFQRNIQFLEDYLRWEEGPPGIKHVEHRFKEILKRGGRTVDQILEQFDHTDLDAVYWCIATGLVHVDLNLAPLTRPEQVHVFLTKRQQQTHSGRQAIAASPVKAVKADEAMEVNQVTPTTRTEGDAFGQASPDALAEATRRYRLIEPWLRGEVRVGQIQADTGITERTCFRWRASDLAAQTQHSDGLVGLLPKKSRRGNRDPKIDPRIQALMVRYVTDYYETPKQRTARLVYGLFVGECTKQNLEAPSYVTFMTAIKARPAYERESKRKGKRAAYAHAPMHWELSMTTPRHGDRPFEVVHLDHTELDIELICSQTKKALGRPWATFMADAYSRRLLAVSVTYDRPSYRSCMLALRECVWRFGRLPQTLVVDGGPEFRSVYFETILARYECTKKTRPGAQPRFGSVCERLFGVTNTMFVHNLQGNTQITRNVRQVTKQVEPKRHAVWTLGELDGALREWAYEIYDTIEHPALGETPREAYERGLREGGQREIRKIAYDEDFLMATLPTTVRGVAMVRSDTGVQINGIRYWSDAFRDTVLHRAFVPVRYDPTDISMGFAYVQGHWVSCRSEHAIHLAGYSERAIGLISEEILRRNRFAGTRYQATTARVAQFIERTEMTEALLAQRQKDAAQKESRAVIEAPESGQSESESGREREASPRHGTTHTPTRSTNGAERDKRELSMSQRSSASTVSSTVSTNKPMTTTSRNRLVKSAKLVVYGEY